MLTDSQLRNNMVRVLESLIVQVSNYGLPISQNFDDPSSASSGEFFLAEGDFGVRGSKKRTYYRAVIAIADNPAEAKRAADNAN